MGQKDSEEADFVRRCLASHAVAKAAQQRNDAHAENNGDLQRRNDENTIGNGCLDKGTVFHATIEQMAKMRPSDIANEVIKEHDQELWAHINTLGGRKPEQRYGVVPKTFLNQHIDFMNKVANLPQNKRAVLADLLTNIFRVVDILGWSISGEHLKEAHSWWCDLCDSKSKCTNATERTLKLLYVKQKPTLKALNIAFGHKYSKPGAPENGATEENDNEEEKNNDEEKAAKEEGEHMRGDAKMQSAITLALALARIEALEKQIKAVEELEGKNEELETKNQTLEESNVSVQEELDNMATESAQKAADLACARSNIEVLKEQIDKKNEENDDLRRANGEKDQQIEGLRAAKNEMKKNWNKTLVESSLHSANADSLTNEVSRLKKEINVLSAHISDCRRKLDENESVMKESLKEKSQLQAKYEGEKSQLQRKIDRLATESAQKAADLACARSNIEVLNEQIDKKNEENDDLRRANGEKDQQIEGLRAANNEMKKNWNETLVESSLHSANADSLTNEVSRLKKEKNVLNDHKSQLQGKIDQQQKRIADDQLLLANLKAWIVVLLLIASTLFGTLCSDYDC